MAVATKSLWSQRIDKSTSLCYLNYLTTFPFFYIANLITRVNTHLDNCTAASSFNMSQTYFQDIFVGCEQQHQFRSPLGALPLKAMHTHSASSLRALLFHSPSSLSHYLSPLHLCCLSHHLLQTHRAQMMLHTQSMMDLYIWDKGTQTVPGASWYTWLSRMSDWLTLLDNRSVLLFCFQCAKTRSWFLQFRAFRGEQIVEYKKQAKQAKPPPSSQSN